MRAGYAPLVPHLTEEFTNCGLIHPWSVWIDVDLSWVEVSQAVYRLPGASSGADAECEHAKKHGIPIVGDLDTLRKVLPLIPEPVVKRGGADAVDAWLYSMANRASSVVSPPSADSILAALPADHQARKDTPLVRGCLDYFPAALAEVARLSKAGNDQHNPGEELHWARGKSSDHADCIVRHLLDRGIIDTDGISHSAKVAWRALALLQEELEAKGAPMSRASR